jgi:asparagine synthase (glutamine-hydrolysing)
MCGINGIFAYSHHAPTVRAEELERTRDHMAARGPDGKGDWFTADGMLGLGHRRLAIIDLSMAGAQPMHSEDGRFTVTFNGEIYNHQQLRHELQSAGLLFRSQSDTEALLHLYQRDGPEMVHALRGMFAFALWDDKERSLFLARDPHGVKPLYYCDDGKTFRFASEVQALLAGGQVNTSPDPAGAVGALLWGSVPEPFTLYRSIRLLPAGHSLTVRDGQVGAPRRYWSLADAMQRSRNVAQGVPPGEEHRYLRERMLSSVRSHLVADVPVGAFLSAGLDSSTLVGLAREISAGPLRTLTLTFDSFRGNSNDECPLAGEIARHLDVAHQCVVLPASEQSVELDRFLGAMDQPTVDGINTWFISKAASQAGLKVAISGLGGDELLGGYSTFQGIPQIQNQSHRTPWRHAGGLFLNLHTLLGAWLDWQPNAAGIPRFGGTPEGAYMLAKGVFMPWELRHVMKREAIDEGLARLGAEDAALQDDVDASNSFEQVAYFESVRYMRNQLLRDTDWVSMAHSLEIRVPLVDSILTEEVIGLAANGRLGIGKSALGHTLTRGLPQAVLDRPKSGFVTPTWQWLRNHPGLEEWRKVKFLRQSRVSDSRRWAYTILHRYPHTRALMLNP